MKKYKQVKIDCFFDSKFSHYSEGHTNLSQKQLEKEIEKLFGFGWRVLKITTGGKNGEKSVFLKLTKKTNERNHTGCQKSRKYTRKSALNKQKTL